MGKGRHGEGKGWEERKGMEKGKGRGKGGKGKREDKYPTWSSLDFGSTG